MLWLHSVRLAAPRCSCSCTWSTHTYLVPVNWVAACHMCVLATEIHILLFAIYLLEIKTFVYRLSSNRGLRFKIRYSDSKRTWRWKAKLSLCWFCTTSYKDMRNGGEHPRVFNPGAIRIWLCSFRRHLRNFPGGGLISRRLGGSYSRSGRLEKGKVSHLGTLNLESLLQKFGTFLKSDINIIAVLSVCLSVTNLIEKVFEIFVICKNMCILSVASNISWYSCLEGNWPLIS